MFLLEKREPCTDATYGLLDPIAGLDLEIELLVCLALFSLLAPLNAVLNPFSRSSCFDFLASCIFFLSLFLSSSMRMYSSCFIVAGLGPFSIWWLIWFEFFGTRRQGNSGRLSGVPHFLR